VIPDPPVSRPFRMQEQTPGIQVAPVRKTEQKPRAKTGSRWL
jgi:hypothetical protein